MRAGTCVKRGSLGRVWFALIVFWRKATVFIRTAPSRTLLPTAPVPASLKNRAVFFQNAGNIQLDALSRTLRITRSHSLASLRVCARLMKSIAGTVCVLIMGQPFRSGVGRDDDMPCNVTSLDPQAEASRSIVRNILHPLASMGAEVRVHATYPQSCGLVAHLRHWYASYPVEMHPIDSSDMCDGWRQAYAALDANIASCDHVMQLRHDIVMDYPIDMWDFNASLIQFERECTDCAIMIDGIPGGSCTCGVTRRVLRQRYRRCNRLCMADHMLWAPRARWPLLDDVVRRQRVCGHSVVEKLRSSFPRAEYGYLFPPTCDEVSQHRMPTLLCDEKAAYRPHRTRHFARSSLML